MLLDGPAFFPRKSHITYPLGTYCFQYSAQDFKRIYMTNKVASIHKEFIVTRRMIVSAINRSAEKTT